MNCLEHPVYVHIYYATLAFCSFEHITKLLRVPLTMVMKTLFFVCERCQTFIFQTVWNSTEASCK